MKRIIFIDWWIENTKVAFSDWNNFEIIDFKSDDELVKKFADNNINIENDFYFTWKLSDVIEKIFPHWKYISPISAIWMKWKDFIKNQNNINKFAILEISASWYIGIVLDKNWYIYKDNIFINPHCGAGSWVNLSRVLQKLNILKEDVDTLLSKYLWENWKEERNKLSTRADRCWVFSCSACVSDKNQWIPLDYALGVTLKSEVLKACKRIRVWVDWVLFSWWIFKWKFARDIAEDYFKTKWANIFFHDEKNILCIEWMDQIIKNLWEDFNPKKYLFSKKQAYTNYYKSFQSLYNDYSKNNKYLRQENFEQIPLSKNIENIPIKLGFDIWSTMAKFVIMDMNDTVLFIKSYSNSWDTIETIKHIFWQLKLLGIEKLLIKYIGITWSGRYQVQTILKSMYPHLKNNIDVLVENYAHARWSIFEAKKYITYLKSQDININDKECVLVDIWWEDTKISIIDLEKWDLKENAMNLKCSAWTWSLMDTLKSLFGICSIEEACEKAFVAENASPINATCAVFLMENAKKLQTKWVSKDKILASCYWAIVENMERTLWSQVKLPKNPLILLHWQTMLSDPLPLAVINRMGEYSWGDVYWLIPSNPWHRACFWLLDNIDIVDDINEYVILDDFINKTFERTIITCQWVACWDKNAKCNRTLLKYFSNNWVTWNLLLWWCSAVNELLKKEKNIHQTEEDFYKTWLKNFFNQYYPKDQESNRIIIPRSFIVSEQAYFISSILKYFNVPVYIDDVTKDDILWAQPFFNIDTCAPNIWASWQFMRLANTPHWVILFPQIESLDTNWKGLWKTCTTNQWWAIIAKNMALKINPNANFFLFNMNLKYMTPEFIGANIFEDFKKLLWEYNKTISIHDIEKAVEFALWKNNLLKKDLENYLVQILQKAIDDKKDIIIVCWREYILNQWVYDSHIWKLLQDKWVIAIPSYVFDIELNESYSFIYWKNPHHIVSIIDAIKNKSLHKILKNPKLKTVFEQIESWETKSFLSMSLVTTFRCWPDTMILPLINEITKWTPLLIIQSDAGINELAHLENRVNTFLNQLKIVDNSSKETDFEICELDIYNPQKLNKETDVIYFPTLDDNNMLVAVLKWVWFTCIQNFYDDKYDLEELITFGRKYVWDSVCAPLAWVFADTIKAVKDFTEKRKAWELEWKTRVFIFNNKWEWPCRQWQYYNSCKLHIHKELKSDSQDSHNNSFVKFLVGKEEEGFDIWLPQWWSFAIFQWIIIQWVLHSIYMKYWVRCKDFEEFSDFQKDFVDFKKIIYEIFENDFKPTDLREKISNTFGDTKIWYLVKYFTYWIYNNNWLSKAIKKFVKKWDNLGDLEQDHIKIHVEWEAYMRVAQINDIFRSTLNILWLGKFEMDYSPIWSYVEYLIVIWEYDLNKEIDILEKNLITSTKDNNLKKAILEKKWKIKSLKNIHYFVRNILAKPLYDSANIKMPENMDNVLESAKKLISSLKPDWELSPYVWEALVKLWQGTDLFLNIAPEGCMVSTMGELMNKVILSFSKKSSNITKNQSIETLLSSHWEFDEWKYETILLKLLWPEKFYK